MALRWTRFALFVVLGAAIGYLRYHWYETGRLHSQTELAAMSIVIAVIASAAFITLYAALQALASSPVPPASPTDATAQVVAYVTIAVAVFTLLQNVLPNSSEQAAAPACRGLAVQGAKTLGQTVGQSAGTGVSARAGAGTVYDQVDRYAANCTIGFDGFCIGESIGNTLTTVADQRWLIVHGRDNELISAAEIRLQSPQRGLTNKPSSKCGALHGSEGPSRLAFTVSGPPSEPTLTADAPGAAVVGFGVEFTRGFASGAYPYRQIGIPTNFAVVWMAARSASRLTHGTGTAYLSAVACYADDAVVPGISAFRKVTFINSKIVTDLPTTDPPNEALLVNAACAGP